MMTTEATMADTEILTEEQPTALVRRLPADVVLMPVMNVALANQRLEQLQEFCASYLQESKDGGQDGGDYGIIPGAGKKKVLLKSGAEKLCDVYGLADRYRILSRVEDFERGLFDYVIECELFRKTDGMFVGSGLGSCSSWESKYRWRDSHRICPQCQSDAIIKGKEEYGGGWLCWAKKGGCGAKFSDTDPAIIDQKVGRIENPDIIDTKNTVLKIAKKRCKIDSVIGVTRSSGIFTQDLEEHELVEPTGAQASEPAAAAASTAPANETHAEKIARIKKEAADKAKTAAPAASTGPHPPNSNGMHTSSGVGPAPEAPAAATAGITEGQTAPAAPSPLPAAPAAQNGGVHVTGINVRNGPMVVKDGKTVPSWGPLYVIAFGTKVRATDGQWVTDATTFDEKVAAATEAARDAKAPVTPRIEPAKKKGSYNIVGVRTPDGTYWAADHLKAHPEINAETTI